MTRPNPLTDELSDEAKQRLSVLFRSMRRLWDGHDAQTDRIVNRLTANRRW